MVAWPYPGDVVVLMYTVMVQPKGWCPDLAFSLFSVYFDDTAYINWINRKIVQIKSLFKYNICHLFLVNFITNLGYQLIYYITWCETKTCKICKTETELNKNIQVSKLKEIDQTNIPFTLVWTASSLAQKESGQNKPSRTRWIGAFVWNEISCRLLSATRARLLPSLTRAHEITVKNWFHGIYWN